MHPDPSVPPIQTARADQARRARWIALLVHARRSAAAVLRLPVDHPDVEDRAQDAAVAFLAAGLRRLDVAIGTPEALVGVISRNCALSQLRQRRTRVRLGERFRGEWPDAAAECGHRRLEAAYDLRAVLSRLPRAHAQALVAIDLEGERIADAARRLGKSYAAVNAQVGHARASARRIAKDLWAA